MYYDTIQRKKLLEPGMYEIQAGHSSADIDVVVTATLKGQKRGCRDGGLWQPADHYDRSRNGYLWEGHMGYDSVAHRADAHVPEELFEKVGGLWQNINEVTREEKSGEWLDDCLVLEYDRVRLPERMPCRRVRWMYLSMTYIIRPTLCLILRICPVPEIIRDGRQRRRQRTHLMAEYSTSF